MRKDIQYSTFGSRNKKHGNLNAHKERTGKINDSTSRQWPILLIACSYQIHEVDHCYLFTHALKGL